MRFNYAIYCSGNATRIIKFYKKYNITKFPLKTIVYDGGNPVIEEELKNIFGEKQFKTKEIGFVFCFGSKILKKKLINQYKNKIINFHPSLLPKYPGLKAIDQAIQNNETELGNTAHFIDEGIDTGQIILQSRISSKEFVNYDTVLDLQIEMLRILWNTIENDPNKLKQLYKSDG